MPERAHRSRAATTDSFVLPLPGTTRPWRRSRARRQSGNESGTDRAQQMTSAACARQLSRFRVNWAELTKPRGAESRRFGGHNTAADGRPRGPG